MCVLEGLSWSCVLDWAWSSIEENLRFGKGSEFPK